jgi:hypothetical protein
LRQASASLNESRTHLTRKCRDPNNTDYVFLETTNYEKIYKKNSISCKINYVVYSSISQASKALKKKSDYNQKTV